MKFKLKINHDMHYKTFHVSFLLPILKKIKKLINIDIEWQQYICQLHSMHLQKEVKCNPKQPSCKKTVSPQKGIVKKDVKSKVAAKIWQINGKNFYDNSGQFVLVSQCFNTGTKFTWIVFFAISVYYCSHFLATSLDFTSLFTVAFLETSLPLFYTVAGLFSIRY